MFILYTVYLYFLWLSQTSEGTFSYRFISFHKTATLEEKLNLYQTLANQLIAQYKNTDSALADYLIISPSYFNPSATIIIKTPYDQIMDLVKTNMTTEITKYRDFSRPVSALEINPNNDKNYIKPIIFILCAIGGAYGIYYLTLNNTIGVFVKNTFIKMLNNLGSIQDQIIKLSEQMALDFTIHEKTASTIQKLIVEKKLVLRFRVQEDNISTVTQNITSIDKSISELYRVINNVIRPTITYIFYSLSQENFRYW